TLCKCGLLSGLQEVILSPHLRGGKTMQGKVMVGTRMTERVSQVFCLFPISPKGTALMFASGILLVSFRAEAIECDLFAGNTSVICGLSINNTDSNRTTLTGTGSGQVSV